MHSRLAWGSTATPSMVLADMLLAGIVLAFAGCDLRRPSQPPSAAGAGPSAIPSAPASASETAALPIKLSAGVALPQPTVDGTVMAFSVDYRFRSDGPTPGVKYLWVIQPAHGAVLEVPAELQEAGTLQSISGELRPESGPYRTAIVEVAADGSRKEIAETAELR